MNKEKIDRIIDVFYFRKQLLCYMLFKTKAENSCQKLNLPCICPLIYSVVAKIQKMNDSNQ